MLSKNLSQKSTRFSTSGGNGSGGVILAIALLCIGSYIFFAVVDYVKAVKDDRTRKPVEQVNRPIVRPVR